MQSKTNFFKHGALLKRLRCKRCSIRQQLRYEIGALVEVRSIKSANNEMRVLIHTYYNLELFISIIPMNVW